MRSVDRRPKYIRICERVVAEVLPGLPEGERLPSTQELCRQYQAGEVTVNKAMALLARQGLVKRVPGRGTLAAGLAEKAGGVAFGHRDVMLRMLTIRGWPFGEAVASLLQQYSRRRSSVSFEVIRAPAEGYEALLENETFDLAMVNTWSMRQVLTTPHLAERFLPLHRLPGLMFDEDRVFENVIRWCKTDDGLMCFPVNVSPVVGLVNPSYPGVSPEAFERARSLEAFLDLLKGLRAESPGGYFPLLLFLAENRWPIFLRLMGAPLFSSDGTRCLLDQPKAVDGVQLLVDMMHRDRLCPPLPLFGSRSVSMQEAAQTFGTGKFGMTMVTHGDSRYAYPFRTHYVPLPEGEQAFTHLHLEGVMVSRDTEYAAEVSEFFNFLMLSENSLHLSECCDGFPCQRKVAEACMALEARKRGGTDYLLQQIDVAGPVVDAPRPEVWHAVVSRLSPVWLGVESPATACREAAAEANAILSKATAECPDKGLALPRV